MTEYPLGRLPINEKSAISREVFFLMKGVNDYLANYKTQPDCLQRAIGLTVRER